MNNHSVNDHPGEAWCHRCSPDLLVPAEQLFQHLHDVHGYDLDVTSRRAKLVHCVVLVVLIAILALLLMTAGATVIEWGN